MPRRSGELALRSLFLFWFFSVDLSRREAASEVPARVETNWEGVEIGEIRFRSSSFCVL